jgi:tRNA uridine 5-carboxymethylaminomethyl modification enzyme
LKKVVEKINKSNELEEYLSKTSLKPTIINPILESVESSPVDQAYRAAQILTRPNITLKTLEAIADIKENLDKYSEDVREQSEINIKYKGYIEKEKVNVDKLNRLENIKISETFEYLNIPSLSSEARQKLTKVQPKTLAQAGRISGVSPSDINVLMIYMAK